MNPIQMVDLKRQFQKIKPEIMAGIEEVCENATFINGAQVKAFSDELKSYTDSQFVIPCANGTDAIQIAFMALGLQAGDEVIVPTWTYVATAEVIALLGLKPVFVDAEYDSFNMDISKIESVIRPQTKAIVPVHLFGQCCDMESIMALANKHNLFVIEDTAQAIGAVYQFSDKSKKQAGTIGHIGTTSFFPSKNLGGYGDGGAILTQDESLARKIQAICDHGQLHQKYHHDIVGVNSRLDSIQAVILRAKLQNLQEYEAARYRLAQGYTEGLREIESILTPLESSFSSHVYHQYTLKILDGKRDALKKHLESHQIPSMIYYPLPLHYQGAYKHYLTGNEDLKISERLAGEVLSLPMHTEMEDEQRDYILNAIKSFYQ